ncbi:YgjV family protein [Ornithinimicrobium pekingense]|uniref:YgjV family protein n=1 Tax=Ornithinimicrobium pekingense TaxID=384677 RepID=A0ABQ2FBK4_9MICO|nr:YgjV family protein [Ornithinimicrobium pekingense]GGK78315.1 hypothetical protein GCM10011509_28550 [Ornithinimicrobium pekingense]
MNWIEVLGWTGSAVLVLSLLQTRLLRLRVINLVGCLVLLVYNTIVEVWPMVGLNVVLALINVVYLWRMLRTRHDERSYTVLEVPADDAYLAYVLDRHREDIARINPGFTFAPADVDAAYLVLHGDATVGVVLARDAGGSTAEVLLDWVTPAYRDFSPGEFVFRDSGLFSGRGVRRVLTPAGMQNPYYGRIGFRPEGDRWVLDVEPARD